MIGYGRHENQGIAALGVLDGELHGGGGPRRDAKDRGALDTQRIHQAGMGFGLSGRRGIRRHWCAQVAKARHGDEPKPFSLEGPEYFQPLVKAAARAMHDKYDSAVAKLSVFDRATCRLNDFAFANKPFAACVDVVLVSKESPTACCKHG